MRWVLGYTAGGTTDIISRLVTQPLTERLGQPFVIESFNAVMECEKPGNPVR